MILVMIESSVKKNIMYPVLFMDDVIPGTIGSPEDIVAKYIVNTI